MTYHITGSGYDTNPQHVVWFCHLCAWSGWLPAGTHHKCEPNTPATKENGSDWNQEFRIPPQSVSTTPESCPACGGSGLHADELERSGLDVDDDIREMLDSTRCYECYGSGSVPSGQEQP